MELNDLQFFNEKIFRNCMMPKALQQKKLLHCIFRSFFSAKMKKKFLLLLTEYQGFTTKILALEKKVLSFGQKYDSMYITIR